MAGAPWEALLPLGVHVIRGSRYGRALALAVIILPALFVRTHAGAAAGPVMQEAHKPPVEVTVVARKYSFSPARIEVDQDDIVKVTLKAEDIPHSFTIDEPYRIAKRAAPGQPVTFQFRADQSGTFVFYCNITTDDRCREMRGQLVVNPKRQ
jgi:heme/copper-type cytochrome/quinol oxidase subunit 2